MPWGDSPEKPVSQPIRGWGNSPAPLPTAGPVEGWWPRVIKAQALAQFSAQGSLDVDIREIHTVPALFTAIGNLSADVQETGDGLKGTMWEGYTLAPAFNAVGSLSALVLARPNLFGQFTSAGTLSAVMSMYKLVVPTQFAAAGTLAATMVGVLPFTQTWTTPGTYVFDAPLAYSRFDLVGIGGGGGGAGSRAFGNGYGAGAGKWNSLRLTRGVNFLATATQITVVVGDHGSGNPIYYTSGEAGGATTFTYQNQSGTNTVLTCAGGAGGNTSGDNRSNSSGASPSPITLSFQGESYPGGAGGGTAGNGDDPGGGGGGAVYATAIVGSGGDGQGWIKALI